MRTLRPAFAASALLTAVILTSCASGGVNMPGPESPVPGSTGSTRPPFLTATPGPVGPTGTSREVPPARWEAIEADLTARGIDAPPELVSAHDVTFSDGSLGCAKPGESYTQAVVDGMRVVVTAAGTTYDYRFGEGDDPRLCER